VDPPPGTAATGGGPAAAATTRPLDKRDVGSAWPARRIRSRWRSAAAVAATIGAGLASRAAAPVLPWWLAKNAGDALYATMVLFGVGLLAPRIRARTAVAIALAFSVAIECSQLYHAPRLDALRHTVPGHLVLGQGFHAFDLVCYAIGVAVGAALEPVLVYRRVPPRSQPQPG
jgi:hypothetical protein